MRLLSATAEAHPLAAVAAEQGSHYEPIPLDTSLGEDTASHAISSSTWDAVLGETHLGELLRDGASGSRAPSIVTTAPGSTSTAVGERALASGLSQLNKYLSRAWYRAGIPAHAHDDSSQAVYATLLQNLGRERFDDLVADVGHFGIKDVFNRETPDGLSFFRAVDMVKKRAQRERVHQSLDSVEAPADQSDQARGAGLRDLLREAIDHKLSPREAALIRDTLLGKSPAEIAQQWGVAPKTISNEKTRVLQKLRGALASHEWN